jgi:trehalose synthase
MARPKFVQFPPHRLDRFEPLLGERYRQVEQAAASARRLLAGRAVWHISSTLRGGGVAEMLRALLPYVRGAGVDTRWVVLRERAEFFELTKRLHNNLHGDRGDGGPLGADERDLYERTLAASARHLSPLLQEGDVVFLHDPQTVGLVPAVKEAGARVVWRCHIGADHADEFARRAWGFLTPYASAADACVFSRRAYLWETLDEERAWVMAPCIDPFSPKNQDLERATVEDIVRMIGLAGPAPSLAPTFVRADGTPARVERRAAVIQETPLPDEAVVVAQLSRWDRLKDHIGLLRCFQRHLSTDERMHLLLAGPWTAAVADDPEGDAVWRSVGRAWRDLPAEDRHRMHLVSLPMDDLDENAAMVNALQRRADIVVQKSLAEGFGLTVAEAMWKRRPVIGTRVGGIQDQIEHEVSGLLIDDPHDLEALAQAIRFLADSPERAGEIGEQARRRVFERFLAANRLVEYVELIAALDPSTAR